MKKVVFMFFGFVLSVVLNLTSCAPSVCSEYVGKYSGDLVSVEITNSKVIFFDLMSFNIDEAKKDMIACRKTGNEYEYEFWFSDNGKKCEYKQIHKTNKSVQTDILIKKEI